MLYGKGEIIENNGLVRLIFNINFRRPSDKSLRSDNVHTELTTRRVFANSLESRMLSDFNNIIPMLEKEWG